MTHTLNRYTEIDLVQFLLQPDCSSDDEVFRFQITDAPEILRVVATPKPVSPPLSYTGTELALPRCGSGVDFRYTHLQMIWKVTSLYTMFTFVDFAGGVTLYQKVNVTGCMVRWCAEGSLWWSWSCRGVSPVMCGLRVLSFLPPLFSTTHCPSFTSIPFFAHFVSSPSTLAHRTSRCSTPRTILRFLRSMSPRVTREIIITL